MDIKPFIKSLFDSFITDLHSTNIVDLQKEIAEGFLTYFGQFRDGDIFILEDKKFSRLSPYELSEELPFSDNEIEAYLTYTKSIHLNTQLIFNNINITPDRPWALGGTTSVLQDLIKGKITYFTFPVRICFTPNIGISYDLSITITNNTEEGLTLSAKPSSILAISVPNKKYSGYYASDDGTMDASVVINKFNLNFNRGNIIKYVIRAGKKNPIKEIEDLEKAKKYIDFEIARIKGE